MQLQSAYNTLQQADHDYQGHRVRAMAEIAMAMRHLGGGGQMNGMGMNGMGAGINGAGNINGAGAGGARRPQAQSDAALRQAIGYLRNARNQLGSGMNGNSAMGGGQGQTHRAHGPISKAINELEVALSIR
jgi:hypothetical protein